ncbi:MAG: Gfo/Idh/MocA family oxidoreductase [Bacteroidota bacterium]
MLKIGVLGAGHLGKIHIRLIKELGEHYQLLGFHDPHRETAREVAALFNTKAFATAEELISQVDCVDIVTPTLYHFELAALALKAGKHVFIEKPVTQTLEEARELIHIASENGATVQVGHVERFNPAFQKALPFFNEPMFIETHRLAQFNPRGTDVPVVLDLMIHDIDVILSVVRSDVRMISASGVAVISESDDITNARIEFENGCVANLTSSRISLKNMRKSRFFQKDAYISVDFLTKELEVFRMQSIEGEADPFDIVFDPGNNAPKKKVLFDKPDIEDTNAIKEELQSFHHAITTQSRPVVSIEDGTKALEVATLILEKLNQAKFSL